VDAELEQILAAIGPRLRSPRRDRGMTLEALSAATGAGELLLVLGEHELTLGPGEVAEIDTAEPHWFGPSGDRPVEILHIFGPRGDKAQLRTHP